MPRLQVSEDGLQNSNAANRKLANARSLCLALCNQRAPEHVACRGGALPPRRADVSEVAVEVYYYHMPPSVLVVFGVQCKTARSRSCEQFWANARRWCTLPPPALGRRGSSGSALLPRVLICLPAYFQWLSSLYVLLPAHIC